MRLPSSWGQSKIHSSLLIILVLLSFGMLLLSVTHPGFLDFKPFVLTLPMIWVISLTVRIAAQHFAIGSHSLEFETLLGPTGNLSTGYEDLPPKQVLAYALAGHGATFSLVLLGALVNLALAPQNEGHTVWSALIDIDGGWGNRALAAQIMWSNLFIGALNLLPTIPFDTRAFLYAIMCRGQFAEEPAILRRLAALDSHLATMFLGAGTSLFVCSVFTQYEYFSWYALAAAAVYLFVASRWELARSLQLEEQYMPVVNVRTDLPARRIPATHLQRGREANQNHADKPRERTESRPTDIDIDEILRKLHREGSASLSVQEQEALLTASQRLQEKQRKSRESSR